MPGTPWRARLAALGATTAIVVAACGGAATPTPAPATAAPPTTAPATEAPFEALTYPTTGEVDCAAQTFNGQAYIGKLKQIKALDAKTVEFTLCTPDVAFLSKVAFASFADQRHRLAREGSRRRLHSWTSRTAPARTSSRSGTKGDHMVLEANPNYWGDKRPGAQPRRSAGAPRPPSGSSSSSPAPSTASTTPAPTTSRRSRADSDAQVRPARAALNVFYLGMNNTYPAVGQREGPPGDRHGHRPPADRRQLLSRRARRSPRTSRRASIPFCVRRIRLVRVRRRQPPRRCSPRPAIPTASRRRSSYRDVVRGYLPDPAVVAQDIQAQLKANLNIDATIEVQESGTYLDNNAAGKLDGLFTARLGRGLPGRHQLPGLPLRRRRRQEVRRPRIDDIVVGPEHGRRRRRDTAVREAAYTQANDAHQAARADGPHRPRRLRHRLQGRRRGRHSLRRSATRSSSAMKPGDARHARLDAERRAARASTAPDETDGETLRVCEQINEGLYTASRSAAPTAIPALATECKPNTELTVWTCTLRDGVTFQDGADARRQRRRDCRSRPSGMRPTRSTRAGRASSSTSASLFGGFLNPPPPAR